LLPTFRRAIDMGGDTEIHDARRAIIVEQDIRRLQVAVDDALGVGMHHRIENRAQDGNGLDRRQGTALLEEIGQVAARHVFKDEIQVAAFLARLENRHDAGVAHAPDSPRLGQQRLILGRVGTGEMQGLDGDLALQLGVETQIDDALCATPQFAPDLETADFFHDS